MVRVKTGLTNDVADKEPVLGRPEVVEAGIVGDGYCPASGGAADVELGGGKYREEVKRSQSCQEEEEQAGGSKGN